MLGTTDFSADPAPHPRIQARTGAHCPDSVDSSTRAAAPGAEHTRVAPRFVPTGSLPPRGCLLPSEPAPRQIGRMTHRIYYDSDTLEFDATVVSHDGDPHRVILDRTAFYPTSGGQPHDTGSINGVRVIDVIDGDDHIVHVLDAPLPLGDAHGIIDASRRRDFTVQHTAQHLISAVAADTLGWNTASVHFGDAHSTIEFDAAQASDAQLESLATACNAAIGAALPVTIDYADAATTTGLRKPSDRDGLIRIVTIEGIDRSACGGTHVNNTAGIGAVYLTDIEKIRGRVRVGYLAGPRITGTLRDKSRTLAELARLTAIAEPELIDVLPRRMEQLRQAEKRIATLEAEL